MAGFLYWFPDVTGVIASSAGIPADCKRDCKHLDGASLECGQQSNGPDVTRTGAMVAVAPVHGGSGRQAVCRYTPSGDDFVPQGQQWQPIPVADKPIWWLGWEKGRPPGPNDVARSARPRGYDVLLGDGNTWKVPVLHTSFITVPTVFRSYNGEVTSEVVDEYRELCAEAEHWWEKYQPKFDESGKVIDEPVSFQHKDIFAFTAAVLGANYRLGRAEISALGLVRNDTWEEIVAAAIGLRSVEDENEARKKKATQPDG